MTQASAQLNYAHVRNGWHDEKCIEFVCEYGSHNSQTINKAEGMLSSGGKR